MQHLIDFHQDTERNIIIDNGFIFKFEKANEVQGGKKKLFQTVAGKAHSTNLLSILSLTKNLSNSTRIKTQSVH